MNKKRAKFNFILTSILLAFALILCFAQFKLPYSNTNYNGLFNSVSATNDISNGYTAVYEITSKNVTDEEVDKTISLMRNILRNQSIDNANVYRQGDYIRAEVQSTSNASNILSIIGDPKSFFISGTNEQTLTEDKLADYDIVGTDIKNAYATTQAVMNKEYNGITIEFTKSGAEKYHELTKQVSAKESENVIYFYIDGEQQTSLEIEESNEDYLYFYFDGSSVTFDGAQTFALQILMSSTGVNLEIISNNTSTPTLGQNALMFALIAFAVALVAVLIAMPFIYGDLGIVADISILFGVAFNIFVLQALPFTTSSIAGVIGSFVGMAILVLCHIIYLNKVKSEFYSLKKLQLSARTGFKKSWLKNLDICAITFLASVTLALWGIPYVSTFGVSLAIGAFVALFNTVVMFKDFVTWYVCINTKNYKRVKFTKGEGNE